MFFERLAAAGPPVAIELRIGGDRTTLETADGEIHTRPGGSDNPDLILTGNPQAILGLLIGRLDLAAAEARGLEQEGSTTVLRRLQPRQASAGR